VRHLYVHVPFCPRICPYCNFYKSPASEGGFAAYVEAVCAEARRFPGPVAPGTVFFGGGTPTALNERQLRALIGGLGSVFDLSGVKEFTVEMNPSTVSASKAETLLALGVNRASVGVQSWHDRHLATLGRNHSAEIAAGTIRTLREAGFENIGIDLIFGIPGQTRADWAATLDRTIGFSPSHISAYSLTYEEDTEFFLRLGRGEFARDEHLDADLFDLAAEHLEQAGYAAYETSNFARPGAECLHNLRIWRGADFLGLGPSAVSTVAGTRWQNLCDTKAYVECLARGGDPRRSHEQIGPAELRTERIALGLRLAEGIDGALAAGPRLEDLVAGGLLEHHNGRIRIPRKARALADEIILSLV